MAGEAAATQTPAAGNAPAAAGAAPGGSVLGDALQQLNAPAGGAPAAAPGAAPAAAAAPTATPAQADGEIKLTVPKDSGLTEDHAKQVADFAKANKLTQAQAEKILERDAEGVKTRTAEQAAAAEKAGKDQLAGLAKVEADGRAAWAKDPDFGGAKLQQSNIDAARVLAQDGDPGFLKWLQEHPLGKALGSDPTFLRTLAKIGARHYREDGGTGPAGQPRNGSGKSYFDETADLLSRPTPTPNRTPLS